MRFLGMGESSHSLVLDILRLLKNRDKKELYQFMLKVKVKVKVKVSALVNVDKNRCSLQINTLRCKLLYNTIVKVRNVSVTSGNRPTGDRSGIIVWPSKRSIYLVLLTILLIFTILLMS